MLFTMGHGARPVESFVAILGSASVGTLVDIRRYPGSRRHPQFGRDALATALAEHDLRYEWGGAALGGRRSARPDSRHTALHSASFRGYADHMDTPEFRAAVDTLVTRAATERLAIMCAESYWRQCHRMLVADALTLRGATVVHLLDGERREEHRCHPTMRRGEDGWPVYDQPDTLPGLGDLGQVGRR
ncbi:hypothetical protein Pme01_40650 [Planosporangium mesophilum]|uniref:DUF488 domain-containing protein n=1 Tax=Planosporangium mesophilum TaxID=689768 RepID=A0A8J3X570_9ACTN|nr:hypothetical protein Pme01_40650 [Planosporangium mesophilum]